MVTMKMIAQEMGVSTATVSLVLSGKDAKRVKPEIAEQIRQLAQRLDYEPNPLARSLRTNRTRIIGFLSDEISTTPYAGKLILGARDAAKAMGYVLLTADVHGDHDQIGRGVDALNRYGVDGFLYGSMYNRPVTLPDELDNTPVVIVDGFDAGGNVASVSPDEYQIGLDATNRLLNAGCRAIAFLTIKSTGTNEPITAMAGRLKGYRHALSKSSIGFDPDLIFRSESKTNSIELAQHILVTPGIDGVFCFNDLQACYIFHAAEQINKKIGTDISIVGVDNQPLFAEALQPELTTIELPHYEMGYWSVIKLVSLIEKNISEQVPAPPMQTKAPLPSLTEINAKIHCALIEKASVARNHQSTN